jgi:hypothetical protein
VLHETPGDPTIYVAVSAVVGCVFFVFVVLGCIYFCFVGFVFVGAKGSTIHVPVLVARPLFLREQDIRFDG